ncbi:M56 family metallopeptidase [Sphingobacterium sp. SYP-B4668]|uniref:M56 family metallopeptidase n=1 Tax=Sphingobacterium sp. SYP-B4668 TaxID=2996035 RepID=UPI0022DD07C4|nr:M56 family metallopeptidase [Sphingobacterium sp. SYP-B4668]
MMTYLIIANVSMIFFYSIYHVLMRKLTFFYWNRAYLLASLLLSILVPALQFVDFEGSWYGKEVVPTIKMGITVIQGEEVVLRSQGLQVDLQQVYWISVGIAFLYLLIRLFAVMRLLRQSDRQMSFSFFHRVHIGKDVAASKIIRLHESIHVKQGHTYDILFAELTRVFNWFNPVLHCYIKELKFVHECIADELSARADKRTYAEILVASALNVPTYVLYHEFSNQSLLKKRIRMLFRHKSKNINRLKYLLIVPLISLVGFTALAYNDSVDSHIALVGSALDVDMPTRPIPISKQTEDTIPIVRIQQQEDKVFTVVEVNPEPLGGMKAFMNYVGMNYNYPKEAIDNNIEGRVEVSFVVEKDGMLSTFKVNKGLGYGTGEEAIRVLKAGGKWSPGIQNGKPVRVSYQMPIRIDRGQFSQSKSENHEGDGKAPAKLLLKSEQSKSEEGANVLFTAVEITPEPQEGMRSFMKYIGDSFEYPKEAIEKGVNGVLQLAFIVEKDGSLSNVEVVKDLQYGTGEAAKKMIQGYNKKWKPGIQNGRAVRVAYTLPIRLNIVK